MYTISPQLESEVQAWVGKLPDSLVKSQITTLFDEVYPTNRMTTAQLEKFLSLQNALPKEFQPYPQTFAQIVKNPHEDTKNVLAESHTHIQGQGGGNNVQQVQEVLQTLGQLDPKKAGTKADPKHINKDLVKAPPKAEKKDAKTGKPRSQAKAEEEIIARNKNVSEKPAKERQKKVVVIEKKTSRKQTTGRRR